MSSQKRWLPCPWCGERPVMRSWHGGAPTKVALGCENESCDIRPGTTGETPEEALSIWQSRFKEREG